MSNEWKVVLLLIALAVIVIGAIYIQPEIAVAIGLPRDATLHTITQRLRLIGAGAEKP